MTKSERALIEAIKAIKAIVEEVAGASKPYSADSYLPPHLVHDAREAISVAEEAQQ